MTGLEEWSSRPNPPWRRKVRWRDEGGQNSAYGRLRRPFSIRSFSPLGLFGTLAFVLAVVGLYGVIACAVAQRTPEIGIRIALGAARGAVIRTVLRQGLIFTAVGLPIGLALAIAAAGLLPGQLIGISATDPVSFVATVVALTVVALGASAIPDRRAARLDPLESLRTH